MALPYREMGRRAAEILAGTGPATQALQKIPFRLIERASGVKRPEAVGGGEMSPADETSLEQGLGAGAMAAAFAAFACAAPAGAAELKMMFQGDPYEIDAINAAAKAFEAANPGTTIELIHTPHDSYNEKIGAAVSARQLPDIIELDAPFLSNYVWSGFLQPIDGLIDPKLLADMTPSNVSQGTYPPDGKLYATSLINSTVVLYASKKQLESLNIRIPTSVDDAWTGEEFQAILKQLSTAEGVKWPIDIFRGYGTKTEWIPYGYEPLLVSSGCDLIDRTTWKASGTLDSDACVKAATMMAEWVKNGWVVPQSAGTNQFYVEGRPAALAWGGFWLYAEAVKSMGDDLVALPLPNFGRRARARTAPGSTRSARTRPTPSWRASS